MKKPNLNLPSLFQTFPAFGSRSIGFDDIFDSLSTFAGMDNPTYPPYNIIKTGDDYQIVIAVAGFKKGEISVELLGTELSVKSRLTQQAQATDENEAQATVYIHRGLALRSFTLSFKIADNVEISSATFENGLLTIDVKHIKSDESKPKMIPIMYHHTMM